MERNGTFNAYPRPPLFREHQHFSQWWLWVVVLGVAAVAWWAFVQQILLERPFGQNPAPDWAVALLWIVIGLGLPFFFEILRLTVEVADDEVRVRFRPFLARVIPMAEIEEVQVRSYNPLLEYGGWGVRGWSRKKMAYNVKGNRGVELTLSGGRRVLLGSQQPEELAAAIQSQHARYRDQGWTVFSSTRGS